MTNPLHKLVHLFQGRENVFGIRRCSLSKDADAISATGIHLFMTSIFL